MTQNELGCTLADTPAITNTMMAHTSLARKFAAHGELEKSMFETKLGVKKNPQRRLATQKQWGQKPKGNPQYQNKRSDYHVDKRSNSANRRHDERGPAFFSNGFEYHVTGLEPHSR